MNLRDPTRDFTGIGHHRKTVQNEKFWGKNIKIIFSKIINNFILGPFWTSKTFPKKLDRVSFRS